MITNLDIYFSNACNLNCTYCCMHENLPNINNNDIVQSLQNNSFVDKIKNVLTKDINCLSIWGLEPNVNGQYFQRFIYDILDFSPVIKYINITSNGLGNFYQNFIQPLINYSKAKNRKLKIWIQISLDGPKTIMDAHRGDGIYNKVLANLQQMVHNLPLEDYQERNAALKFRLTIKPTFEAQDLYTSPEAWYIWKANLEKMFEQSHYYVESGWLQFSRPTLKFPHNYTKEDGQALAKWNIDFDGRQYYTCAAGITSKAIDYQGNLYDCHLLKNKNFDFATAFEEFNHQMDILVAQGEAIEQDRKALFNAISKIFCWGVDTIESLPSYIRLLGNGVKIIGG